MNWIAARTRLPIEHNIESMVVFPWVLVWLEADHPFLEFSIAAYDHERGDWYDLEGFPVEGVTHWAYVEEPK